MLYVAVGIRCSHPHRSERLCDISVRAGQSGNVPIRIAASVFATVLHFRIDTASDCKPRLHKHLL
jgi:hypothetical protein